MNRLVAAASAAAIIFALSSAAVSQSSTPATPVVGSPVLEERAERPVPSAEALRGPASTTPLPSSLSLAQSVAEADARSPAIIAAEADVRSAEALARQAGYRSNPELSVEVENFGGTGELRGFRTTETTVAINQRLDLGGRRSARRDAAGSELNLRRLQLAVVRADVAQDVRQAFARAIAARERLAQADENFELSEELARVAGVLVEAGREPPLRAIRARSALARAEAEREAARAEELAARTTLASLLGSNTPIEAVVGSAIDLIPSNVNVDQSLAVRVAAAEVEAARAALRLEQAERRLDPAVGLGVRHVRETGDFGLVAGLSMPIPVFNRNGGAIQSAREALSAAEARQRAALIGVTSRGRNAVAAVEAAERRVAALRKAALPEAREALRLAQLSYTEGRSTLVELLDAQNAYISTQAALTEAELALAIATAELGRIAAQ